MTAPARHLTIIGAGLAGALLGILLRRRGWDVDLYEKRGDPRLLGYEGGRSINLALAERGRHALRAADADDAVMHHAIMMRGRMVHIDDAEPVLQRYGRDDSEVIWSVHRGDLNVVLLDLAEAAGARLHFDQALSAVNFDSQRAVFVDPRDGREHQVRFEALIGADGAGSALRAAMHRVRDLGERSDFLDHGYKELEIPPTDAGDFRIEPHALHIWPRGHYMCIALPNDERTFTVTLFLPHRAGDGDGLPRPERELGAAVASRVNGCVFCASVHARFAEQLSHQGIAATVVDPVWALPVSGDLVELCREHAAVVTLEDSGVAGGLGTRLALELAEQGVRTPVYPLGIPQRFLAQGSRSEILEDLGLTAQALARTVVEFVVEGEADLPADRRVNPAQA